MAAPLIRTPSEWRLFQVGRIIAITKPLGKRPRLCPRQVVFDAVIDGPVLILTRNLSATAMPVDRTAFGREPRRCPSRQQRHAAPRPSDAQRAHGHAARASGRSAG